MRRATYRPRRRGFTLVELLVVMVVLGILIALLVPAIAAAVKTANAAAVTAEINNIATALAQFKSNYSDYPPSRVLLNENGNYNTTSTGLVSATANPLGLPTSDVTVGFLSQRTVRYMTKFFPRALSFSTTGTGTAVDINGDGNATGQFYLSGDEALVFFLGGVTVTPTQGGGPIGMNGFSRNPANPFDRVSTSRTQPLYEFRGTRLVDIDGDGFPSYYDTMATSSQGRYYAYFSAYGSNAYDPNDCNLNANDLLGKSLGDNLSRAFQVNFQVENNSYNSCYGNATNICVSSAPNPYTVRAPIPPTGSTSWQNPQSFQLISAGADQVFWVGGQFAGNNTTNRLPIPPSEISGGVWTGGLCAGGTAIEDQRVPENDNLSNFINTRLNQ